MLAVRLTSGLGLSPRVRGNPLPKCCLLQILGSIPACAGEPPLAVGPYVVTGVYPRVCGGTPSTRPHHNVRRGLSPRVREPIPSWASTRAPRVYPRVCGGTPAGWYSKGSNEGLSPRVRGNPQASPFQMSSPGLSPRVRGNLRSSGHARRCLGSIPACAGNPPDGGSRPTLNLSIPACAGEPRYHRSRSPVGMGLSPRVRGNLRRVMKRRARRRSIPACAGEPRREGGFGKVGGLSPRVRGNRSGRSGQ